ncbi:MAG TPA: universal stress protein [Beijerinckiaceae bacterium]|nr:universal stress protein [Beijerinckiaceae bacterium]
MKTILVPTAAHDLINSVLETALLTARRFGSYVEGFALRPLITEYVPVDMVGGLTWARDDISDEQAVAAARQTFERFMADRGVARFAAGAVGYGWLEDATAGDAFVSSHARVFDLTVLGRPTAGQAEPSMATLEAVLFESGRPILIAPPTAPATLGEVIVIAWNGSTETARATGFAMPFLKQARRVLVMTVEGGPLHGPSGEQMSRSLRLNDVAAEAVTVSAGKRSIGEAFLKSAESAGADLLIKGAYTQSRLRQMIFGGTTSHILAEATMPVLMAH